MKLSELFPKGAKVTIQGQEYELRFNTRAILQLEYDYPDKELSDGEKEKTITSQRQISDVIAKALGGGMRTADLVNLLYADLLHTKAFPNKDSIIDAIEPCDFAQYADAIFYSYMQAQRTPEQIEKLEIMSAASKKKPADETTAASGHSIELSAD